MRRQLAASIVARVLGGGLQFVFTPVYLSILGAESYGLIGFYLALFGLLLFLDQAVSPVVTRHFAQAASSSPPNLGLGDVFRTMQALSLITAAVVFALITVLASHIATSLLHASARSADDTIEAVRLIALVIAVQWPSFMYAGVLSGTGQQVSLNTTRGAVAIAQWVGGALLLTFARANIHWLFTWQASCFAIQTLILRRLALQAIAPSATPSRLRASVLTASWRFSAGALIIGLTGSILTQADKLFVSRFESLSVFAAYSLAFTVASLVQVFVAQPVMAIAFPHFSRSLATGDENDLARDYRGWTQAIVAVVMPLTATLVIFPEQVLSLWLHGHPATVQLAATYLPWIAAGTMFNVIMMLPFNLQMASGWTSLSSIKNTVLLPPFLFALAFGIPREGPVVGAICWFAVNFTYFVVEVPIMHGRLLRDVLWPWWLWDTLAPGMSTIAVCLAAKLLLPHDSEWATVAAIVGWLSSTALLGLTLEFPRRLLLRRPRLDVLTPVTDPNRGGPLQGAPSKP